jgi:two-component system, sensor histidine kinase YesM
MLNSITQLPQLTAMYTNSLILSFQFMQYTDRMQCQPFSLHAKIDDQYFSGFRTLLLTFTFCMLGAVLSVVMIFFMQIYSVINDMSARITQYITIDQLSNELQAGKEAFSRFFSTVESGETISIEQDAQTAAVLRYKALLTIKTLNADYAESPQKYFLNRAIINGLDFINQKSVQLEESSTNLKPETYKCYYQVLKVYDYLLQYTNYLYLSAAVSNDAKASARNIRRIRLLKILSGIFIVFIVAASIISALIITRSLARHVDAMVGAADTITQGYFTTPDLPLTGPREFITLKDKINCMKHRLGEQIELEKQLHAQDLEHEKITKELERARYLSLQAQINPHFLFNTLTVISNTALFEHADNTRNLINSLAGVFRYRLEFNNEVTLAAELKFVEQYLAIQKARFGDRISYTITSDQKLAGLTIPPFVIQPFVENAVIHGIEPLARGGEVTVSVRKGPGQTAIIRISDNGTGIPLNFSVSFLESDSQNQHIGITNVINRLTMYFGKQLAVCIRRKNKTGGTVVVLQIPRKRH